MSICAATRKSLLTFVAGACANGNQQNNANGASAVSTHYWLPFNVQRSSNNRQKRRGNKRRVSFEASHQHQPRNGVRSQIMWGHSNAASILKQSEYGWYQITMNNVKYLKEEVLNALMAATSPYVLVTKYWSIDGCGIVFYTDDFGTADRISGLGGRARMPNGIRLVPRVRGGFPSTNLNDDVKEKIRSVMAKRYNSESKALDLSKFHADPEFNTDFCPLFRSPIMRTVIEIIENNIPEMEAINLNDNKLVSLVAFQKIQNRLSNLKVLYLANNNLKSSARLLEFRKLPIIEVVLTGNPFVNRFHGRRQYVREIRRKFPKLEKLDGELLPSQKPTDKAEALPLTKAAFVCDENGTKVVLEFLDQYFSVFDSGQRQPLLYAYHEKATVSLSVPPASEDRTLNRYWKYNCNARQENGEASMLRVGRLQIVSMLDDLPKTKHDRASFTMDLTLFTPQMIIVSVTGLFTDYDQNDRAELRYFMRQFVIVPEGSGYCITNETILMNSASVEQKRAHKEQAEHQSAAMRPENDVDMHNEIATLSNSLQNSLQFKNNTVPVQEMMVEPELFEQQQQQQLEPESSAPAPLAIAASALVPEETKMKMVTALKEQSNMNFEWSKKCLEETNWDYNYALFAFNKLFAEKKIPSEAFSN